MRKELYKLINGRLVRAPKMFLRGGELVEIPESSLIRFGYVPLEEVDKPDVPEGYKLKTAYEYVREEPKNHSIPERARKCISILPIYEVVKIPHPPRTFSKLKITAALMKIEKWLPVRDYLVQSGLYDLYLAAQDFKEDDEFFVKGLTELKAQFGLSDEEVEAILKEGVV